MGKINQLKGADGSKIYPVTIGDAVAIGGKTLTHAIEGFVEADEALDSVENVDLIPTKVSQLENDRNYLQADVFNNSPASDITQSDITRWNNPSTNADTVDGFHMVICESEDDFNAIINRDNNTFYYIKENE